MKHKREHYETVYLSLCRNSQWAGSPVITLGNYDFLGCLNIALINNNCIPFTQQELYEISESME